MNIVNIVRLIGTPFRAAFIVVSTIFASPIILVCLIASPSATIAQIKGLHSMIKDFILNGPPECEDPI